MTDDKIKSLSDIYTQIHNCSKCFQSPGCKIVRDREKVVRVIVRRSLISKVFLVGQALGGQTQRLSGRPYTKTNLDLSQTGKSLDQFLRFWGYSINPSNQDGTLKLAYSSDIVQCYPGKQESGKNDRKPENNEVINCINQKFLLQEIEIIDPKLILLMGKTSRDTFYKYILKLPYSESLTWHINQIVENGEVQKFKIGGKEIPVIPIQHPSGANPNFRAMLSNKKLVNLISEVLRYD